MASAAGQTKVTVSHDLLVQSLPDEETVFLNVATEQYFSANPVATRMWRALEECGSVERAHDVLAGEFDVAPEVLRRDLDELVETLVGHGFITVDRP